MIAIGLLLYAAFQPYKAKYAAYNKVTIAMIGMMTISLFSAARITIASNKMYQATTFSVAFFGFVVFLPQIYLIIIVIKTTSMHNKLKRYISNNTEQDSDDHAVLINTASRELH